MPMPRTAAPALLVATALLALSGCATPSEDYPSLAIRDAERISGTFAPPEPEPAPLAPLAAETLDRLTQIASLALESHSAFTQSAPDLAARVAAGRGAETGSEAWAQAQVALGELEALRSATMIPLADLDRIYIDAATQGTDLSRITTVRGAVEGLVAEQSAVIEAAVSGQAS